jgi:ammonium transporter, Amt family
MTGGGIMNFDLKSLAKGAALVALFAAVPSFAQEAAAVADAVATAAPVVAEAVAAAPVAEVAAAPAAPVADKGDTAWMLTATALVFLMTIPGLALFYGLPDLGDLWL